MDKRLGEKGGNMALDSKKAAEILVKVFSPEREVGIEDLDLVQVRERLEEKLVRIRLSKISVQDIEKRINQETSSNKIFNWLCKMAVFSSEKDIDELMKLLTALWNKIPHEKFKGMSPEERKKEMPRGPQEDMLIHEMMNYVQSKIDPGKYPKIEKAQGEIERLQNEWLHTPQVELDGKSPWGIILKEREKMGNPNRNFTIRIELSGVPNVMTEEGRRWEQMFEEALRLSKTGEYKKAIKLYERLMELDPENYIAWGNMGNIYALLGKKEMAIKFFHKALSINPKYKLAKENLAVVDRSSPSRLKRMAKRVREETENEDLPLITQSILPILKDLWDDRKDAEYDKL